jgi:MoaA/NifB/PqqE/SkfB family radical SAM enzyme
MLKKKILLNIEATPSCPAKCSMCPRSLVKEDGFMKIETMEKIVRQVDSDSVWEIDLAGRGEPTIHPEFYNLTKAMRIDGVPSAIVTTGVVASDKVCDAINDNLDILRISVSSIVKETFDQVHIGLDHARIWRNIEAIAKVAAHKSIIHLTGGPVIYRDLPATVQRLRELGFSQFRLLTLWNRGGHFNSSQRREERENLMRDLQIAPSENEAWSGSGKVQFMLNFAKGRLLNKNFCPIGDSSMSISFDGKILGCFQDFGHSSNIGDLDHLRIRDVIKSRVKELGNMKICSGCDANKVTLFDFRKK